MFLITGDIHGLRDKQDLERLSVAYQEVFDTMTKEDYLIITGDFGLVWDSSLVEIRLLQWLEERNFTTLFVDGNHENFDLLELLYPVEYWKGGKIRRISQSVIQLMRGQIFEIDGKSFFTMGGAESHDKPFRIKGISWWQQELPNKKEMQEARANLLGHRLQVDYVITHCLPTSIQHALFGENSVYPDNLLTDFLEEVACKLNYQHWYCGHYHHDGTIITNPKMHIIYRKVKLL
ncbi:MAG: metallophosphoesterase [Oscillospiraceae bacterium]|nr:metallophosphoesterase [Ruminococcus sp.]MDE6708017.1 metallophosphoesterase [Oscillospiraceae bacterium]